MFQTESVAELVDRHQEKVDTWETSHRVLITSSLHDYITHFIINENQLLEKTGQPADL